MKTKLFIVLCLAVLVAATVALRHYSEYTPKPAATVTDDTVHKPRLLELGSVTCIPCKMMKEVLSALQSKYSDQMSIEFIDVFEDTSANAKYGITLIPTQIFYGSDGDEFFRHEGFYSEVEVVAKWKEHGYELINQFPTYSTDQGVMMTMFQYLTSLVGGAWYWALIAAFLWGVLSILLSPCHLASIPLIVGFINGQGSMTTKRACAVSSLFSFGILLSIALIGVVTVLAGRMMGDTGSGGNYLVSLVLFLVGLQLMGVIPMPWSAPGSVKVLSRGLWAAFILGLLFGIALGPCTFAFMAPMIAIAFKSASSNTVFGTMLLLVYGVGHCLVIIMAGTFTEVVQRYMNWNEQSRSSAVLKIACGALVICAGLFFVYTA